MDERKLTRETIVAEALALINAEGVQSLTMRKLAQRFEISAPTLYWYFPDKATLTAAMIETLFDRVLALTGETEDPKDWMHRYGRAVWRVHSEAPHTALLIMSAEAREASLLRNAKLIEQALDRLPGDSRELMLLQASILSLMTGWAAFAHTSYSGPIKAMYDVEVTAMRGLQTLIDGWMADNDRL